MQVNVRKIIKNSIAFIVILTLTYCSENVNEPEFPITEISITDDELYDLAYSDYEWPGNFYYEDLSGGALYYENTISINSDEITHDIELIKTIDGKQN